MYIHIYISRNLNLLSFSVFLERERESFNQISILLYLILPIFGVVKVIQVCGQRTRTNCCLILKRHDSD